MTFLSSKVLFYRRQWYVNSLLLSFWVQRSLFEIFQVEVWQCSMATNGNYCSQVPKYRSMLPQLFTQFQVSSRHHLVVTFQRLNLNVRHLKFCSFHRHGQIHSLGARLHTNLRIILLIPRAAQILGFSISNPFAADCYFFLFDAPNQA